MKKSIEKIIKIAGKIIKENFFSKKEIKYKGIIDLVTKFDIEIENFLREEFNKLLPTYSIIGEEITDNDNPHFNSNRIYIDPIDGTTNFVHSIPFVSISVAIISDNKPHIGIVYNPILDEYFFAEKDKGAFLNSHKIVVSKTDNLSKALVTTGFPYSIREDEDMFKWNISSLKKVLKNTLALRRLGSAAIDLCYVARGSYDIFYEANLKPWDVAAGILIVEEAGGKITNEYNNHFNIHKDSIIIASNGNLHNQFIELLNS